jgi:hypothetical protein
LHAYQALPRNVGETFLVADRESVMTAGEQWSWGGYPAQGSSPWLLLTATAFSLIPPRAKLVSVHTPHVVNKKTNIFVFSSLICIVVELRISENKRDFS